MSEIRIVNLCHKKTILVDIYRPSLLSIDSLGEEWRTYPDEKEIAQLSILYTGGKLFLEARKEFSGINLHPV